MMLVFVLCEWAARGLGEREENGWQVVIQGSSEELSNHGGHTVEDYFQVEYRTVSCVFQNIDPPPPSPPGEVNILEDARHRIGLLQ